MSNKINTGFIVVTLMILTAALSRLLPHPPNFTPVGGMALFAAAYFKRKEIAILVPIAAMFLSDLFLNNVVYARMYPEYYNGFQWFGMTSVYISFVLIGVVGIILLKKVNVLRLLSGSLIASTLFFLITNAETWASPFSAYTKNFTGLITAYTAGLPFFFNTIAGDLVYAASLFGIYAWVRRTRPELFKMA